MARSSSIARRVEALLDTAVVATSPVAGGDICTATRLRLSDGRSAFVKARPRSPSGFFEREAEGLRWLSEADGVPTPEVFAVADDCLVLSWIEPGRVSAEGCERFGRALAATHAAGAEAFGGRRDGFIGVLPLSNQSAPGWPEFYATRRVLPYLRAARDGNAISDAGVGVVEGVLARLRDLGGPPEPPSRIHGDLWSANVVWGSDTTGWLVDPAAHGGHRETDLAMLALFGAPHLGRMIAAYDEVAPLADGWEARVPIHQLHPLLVHAALFGGSYGERAVGAAHAVLDGGAG